MKLYTRHFGEIEVDASKKIYFRDGLPGFEHLKNFLLFEIEDSEFCYLQALEDGQVCFAIISPYIIVPQYAPLISEVYFKKLGGGSSNDYALYVIATVRETLEETTLNLQAPLLIHLERHVGVQAIVEDKVYRTRHTVATLLKEKQEKEVAYACTNQEKR